MEQRFAADFDDVPDSPQLTKFRPIGEAVGTIVFNEPQPAHF
jgi:hypothetical protein